MDLRLHLMSRIVAIAAACLLLASLAVLLRSDRDLELASRKSAETAARLIEARLLERSLGYARAASVDDLAQVLEPAQSPGQCIRYVAPDPASAGSACQGWDADAGRAPGWFAALLGLVRGGEREVGRPVVVQGTRRGVVLVSADAGHEAAQAWREVMPMLGLSALSLVALCALTWFTIDRALRPTRALLDTIDALQRGDLARRAPAFHLRELDRIGTGLNRLAESLQTSLADRAELTGRLVRVQEDERRFLARELHDEFAQCLAGIKALAAVIVQSATGRCAELVPQGERIAGVADQMMLLLASMLARLRPPGLDELGLVESLRALVATWNGHSLGRTRYSLEISGEFERLPEPLGVSLYRLVQEALTNAAKHADARRVSVRMARGAASADGIRVEVENDDAPGRVPGRLLPGRGLIGMRERVSALGGVLSFSERGGGLCLRAEIPLPIPGAGATG